MEDNVEKISRKKEWMNLLFLSIFVLIIFAIIVYAFNNKKNEDVDKSLKNSFQIKDVEYGFLYYDGYIYYKDPNLMIYDISKVGPTIGKNEKHIKMEDIENKAIVFDNEKLCVYAEYEGTEVFPFKDNQDILLIKSDYAINSYFVYVKNILPSESYKGLDLYIKNKINSNMLISYGMEDIDKKIGLYFNISELEKINDDTISFNSTIVNGKMIYYLLFEEYEGVYRSFKGQGNVLSDIIIFESKEDENIQQYKYTHKGLSNALVEIYSDFFGFNKSNNTNVNSSEKTYFDRDKEEFYETDIPDEVFKDQNKLSPLH